MNIFYPYNRSWIDEKPLSISPLKKNNSPRRNAGAVCMFVFNSTFLLQFFCQSFIMYFINVIEYLDNTLLFTPFSVTHKNFTILKNRGISHERENYSSCTGPQSIRNHLARAENCCKESSQSDCRPCRSRKPSCDLTQQRSTGRNDPHSYE
mgnify:CR=1 FL=1